MTARRSLPAEASSTVSTTTAALTAPTASAAVMPSTHSIRGRPRTRERSSRMMPANMSGGNSRNPRSAGEGTGGEGSSHRTSVKYVSPPIQQASPEPMSAQARRSRRSATARAKHSPAPMAITTRWIHVAGPTGIHDSPSAWACQRTSQPVQRRIAARADRGISRYIGGHRRRLDLPHVAAQRPFDAGGVADVTSRAA